MKPDRTFITFAIAALAIVVIGCLRPPSLLSGLDPDVFWDAKLGWQNRFDVVIAGDSRVYRGVSPQAMQGQLAGYRIGNYGFSSCGYGALYLQKLPQLFSARSKRKILILGITPNSLTEKSANQENSFLAHLKERNKLDRRIEIFFDPLLNFFQPYSYQEFKAIFKHRKQGYYQHYYPDGWVSSTRIPEEPDDALDEYYKNWKNQKISPAVEASLLANVRRIRRQGIQVYGFQPPTSNAMRQLERSMSGFSAADFQTRFEQAGGTWISIQNGSYHSYDGSHLRYDSAIKLSKIIAASIR